jgi:SagB-type dehydrogenase family enzyme
MRLDELGEFLYRVFRVRQRGPADPDDPTSVEVTRRPLPSAGAAHDLEVYVAAGRADTGRGLFHYHPEEHTLTEVTGDGYPLATILSLAQASSKSSAEPPAVIVLASRFGRLAWRYEGIAYTATLKNVGVAYEAMYLVATAMGLAGCGLGSGASAAFAQATGARPYVEAPVGEFMIGPGA